MWRVVDSMRVVRRQRLRSCVLLLLNVLLEFLTMLHSR